ncbi:MAG TPA: shufflon system plasmid conjugative transfer pilus tip adhesin PilV [Rhodospirillaceae bacterium]|nr:shufflon system plasmid conjugative transfer pilus tip adhesin PilV [Rhodospirillaceae bacterium]
MIGGALELMMVIGAASMLLLAFTPLQQTLQNWTYGATAAWEQRMIRDAANRYIGDNWAAVYAAAAAPTTIPLSTLQSAGYLSGNLATAKNPWQQTYAVVVAQAGVNQLTGYVASLGGNAIPVNILSNVASWSGEFAGYVPYGTDPAPCAPAPCAKGIGLFWQMPLSAFAGTGAVPTAGHLVNGLFFNGGQAIAPYLYRIPEPGCTDCYTMHQQINMNANDINAAANVNATVRMTAPVFADSGNPGSYYLQPAGISVIKDLQLRNLTGSGNAAVTGSVTAGAFLYPP